MPSKHGSPSAVTSNPLFNCLHALKTDLSHYHRLKTPFQLSPMPSNHFLPSAITSNPLFNCPHARKKQLVHCNHLETPCQMLPCPQNTFHLLPPPPTPFSSAPMYSKRISPSATRADPLFNCPHALKTHLTHCHHLKIPFQLPPCLQKMVHRVPAPQTPFSTAPMLAKSISPIATTPDRLFNCPHALKTHFTYCDHLQRPFQVPACTQKTFHQVPPPQTRLTTAPMPSKQSSPSAITSKPLFNCLHARQTRFTHCHQLHTPCHLTPCPPNTFHRLPPPPTPSSTAPMPSEHISPTATNSDPHFEGPHALQTHFTDSHHLQRPFQLPPRPQNPFHPVPPPPTPFLRAHMPSKHISPGATTSNPLFNCRHALKTNFS